MQVKNIPLEERLIFALDVAEMDQAKELVRMLEPETRFFKVGLQLFLAGGFPMVQWIVDRGLKVMLDLKFYDIPQTVELAVRQLQGRGISFATVHGNRSIMQAAARGADGLGILAVTVLTSLGQEEMEEFGARRSIEELVISRAVAARDAGCIGIVCSPKEAAGVRRKAGSELIIVTPGIRPETGSSPDNDDQARSASPFFAVLNGSDYLVVGRPVRDSDNPAGAARAIKKEIARALEAVNR